MIKITYKVDRRTVVFPKTARITGLPNKVSIVLLHIEYPIAVGFKIRTAMLGVSTHAAVQRDDGKRENRRYRTANCD